MKLNLFSVMAFVAVALFSLTVKAQDITEPAQYYLMHSGGNHLAMGANNGGVLEAANVPSPQIMTITPVGDGFYTISEPGGMILSLQGRWNTVFAADPEPEESQYSIESVGKFFIKLKLRSNKKYLGTDNVEDGSNVYTDKSGDDSNHYWYLSTDPTLLPQIEEVSYMINPSARRQKFDGWGVSLCWWANMCGKWSDEKIDELVGWLVSPDELNYRIFRYNIGGGDDPENNNCDPHHMGSGKGLRAEMEGFKDSSDGPYIWTRDEAQRKIMLKIKEKRPDAIFEAFSNSAPYYMTYSGCCAGNYYAGQDNLMPEYYEEFAHYLVDVCKHYKDEYGIEFATLDPFNEPMTNYWGSNGGQEGCHFDVDSQIAFIKVLAPILKESGLSTVISASDETSVAQSVNDYVAYRDAGVLDLVGQWNTHSYTADDYSRSRLSALCAEDGKRLWMSEVGAGGSGISGNISLAQKLINDMRFIMPSAWVDWQYVEDYNDQWCLVKAPDFSEKKFARVKNYYVRKNFSHFIKENSTILTTLNGQSLAALNEAEDMVSLVIINAGPVAMRHIVDLTMFDSVGDIRGYVTSEKSDLGDFRGFEYADGKLTVQVEGKSVVTLEIPVSVLAAGDGNIRSNAEYIIYPRLAAALALDAAEGKVKIDELTYSDSQRFTLAASGNGHTITNAAGEMLSEIAGSYSMTTVTAPAGNEKFIFSRIGDESFFKIMNSTSTKALDLNGRKYAAGTEVGLYRYDDMESPVHRHWGLICITKDESGVEEIFGLEDESDVIAAYSPYENALKIENLTSEPGQLRIFDLSGREIFSSMLAEAPSALELPMGSGLYAVTFLAASGRRASRLIPVK